MTGEVTDPLIGAVIEGRFEVLAFLGQGGMGTVYRGLQRSVGREVAIKVLDHRADREPTSVKRFYREAKVSAALQHPNVVQVIDFGQHSNGRLYIAMELLRGRTLFDEARAIGSLPVARVLDIGAQLCDALDAAHRMSIVHRDLKLENVMLVDGLPDRDHVKVLDFGLARMLDDPNTQATGAGLISGTPRYMAPELAFEAAAPAPAHDMYAVGVMLAELVLGRPLWTAPSLEQLFTAKVASSSDPQFLSEVPPQLRTLVRALLSEEPTRRPTAAAARETLRDAALASLVAPSPAKAKRGKDEESEYDAPAVLPKLELDAAYLKERAAKEAALAAEARRARRRRVVKAIVWLVVLAGLAVGGLYGYRHLAKKPDVPPDRTPDAGPREVPRPGSGAGVTVNVKSKVRRAVTIDGRRAGYAPFSIKMPRGTRPVLIEAENAAPYQIVPDRDHELDLDSLERD
ncbi:MAG: serine/threonine protein kinase [Deltaproteobacteria bacterium]|nr:serine/threonine protein kinase [Deltaproteobacteria bacterium]